MAKTIKQLEEELASVKQERYDYYEKCKNFEKEKERRDNTMIGDLRQEREDMVSQVRNLMEIVRWHINPTTTTSPFMPTKDQREDKRERF